MSYRNILLIDDDEDDQEIFLTAMKELPAKVHCTAESRAEISPWGKLKRQRQIVADLIFLDLNMPIMNGQEFLKELNKNEELKQHTGNRFLHFLPFRYDPGNKRARGTGVYYQTREIRPVGHHSYNQLSFSQAYGSLFFAWRRGDGPG